MKNNLKKLLAVAGLLALGAGCVGSNTVEVGFRVERNAGDGDAPVSEIYLVTEGLYGALEDPGRSMGRGQGCKNVEPEDFDYPQESLAEVYCYFAGGGDLFQARVNSGGDLEVVRYEVVEVLNYEAGTNSIDITNPESVYTFDLEEGWEVKGM